MKKRAKVHPLPTDKAENCIVKHSVSGNLYHHDQYFTQEYLKLKDWSSHHLYFTTDDEIKEGDWYYVSGGIGASIGIYKAEKSPVNNDWRHKIIATTDPELIVHVGQDYTGTVIRKDGMNYKKLPQPPKSFIEEYCKAGGIDEVDVEYIDDCCNFMLGCYKHKQCNQNRKVKLKIDSNNEIIIHPIKDSWTREEVLKIIKDFAYCLYEKHGHPDPADTAIWIKKNL